MKLLGITDGVKVIASVGCHDYVTINDIMHDGGQPGTHQYAGYNRYRGDSAYFEVPQTYAELYTDYQINYGNRKRSYGIWDIGDVSLLDFDNVEKCDTFEYEVSQAIWGTRGIDGDELLKFVHLVDCSTTHLKAILNSQKISNNYIKIIDYIINSREN